MFGSFGNASNTSSGAFGNATQPQQQQTGTPVPAGSLFSGFGGNNANANQAQPPAGSTLFGSNAQTGTTGGGGGLFGNTAQAGTSGGGLFGGTSNTGGSLFGNTQPQQQQQQQPQQQQQGGGGGGLFGSTSTQPATGGLFGAQTNTGGGAPPGNSLFGSTTANNAPGGTGGGLFGSTNTNTTGGGLFGNTAGTGNTGTGTSSGGMFGNAGGGGSGGGLFGNTGGSNANAPGGAGLFGSTTGNNNTNPTGGSLFGNPAGSTNTGGGGLFGNTTGGSFFGSTANQSTNTPGGGLFNNPNNQNSLFGQTQPQQQGAGASFLGQQPGSLFGNLGQSAANTGGNLFGGSTLGHSTLPGATSNSLFSSRAPLLSSQQQADPQSQFISLTQRIEAITHAWMPNSPQCRFQHYFYNLVDPRQVHLYGRPANATNDVLWQKAVRENPDPSCLVPVIAIGFDDLQKRVEAQAQQAAAHQERLKELQKRIADLAQRHQLSNTSRLSRASALQTQLMHRVLKVVQHLHLLIPALRSSAIRPEEEALRAALEDIDQEIRRPGGTGRIRGKLNELWALVGAVNAARERDRKGGAVEWAVVDDEGLAQLTQILAEEQAGLAHVTKILQRDIRDLAVIHGAPVKEEEADTLMDSTTTLRSSTLY